MNASKDMIINKKKKVRTTTSKIDKMVDKKCVYNLELKEDISKGSFSKSLLLGSCGFEEDKALR